MTPIDPDGDGRRPDGRFGPGNRFSRGNPLARQVGRLRSRLLAAVTPEDIEAVAKALVKRARSGDVAATRELLDRLLGKPVEADLIERLERLESTFTERQYGEPQGAD